MQSELCNLAELSPAQLIQKGEEAEVRNCFIQPLGPPASNPTKKYIVLKSGNVFLFLVPGRAVYVSFHQGMCYYFGPRACCLCVLST